MSDPKAATKEGLEYIYGETPPNVEKRMILLTTGKVAVVQPWGDGLGVIGYCGLPKRNLEREEELGL